MTAAIAVLLLEDNPSDAKLIAYALRRGGLRITIERVQDEHGMRTALGKQSFDIVLSDWAMPRFNALGALRVTRELATGLPFIIVSGTIGEEAVVQAMRSGASDYVPKNGLSPRLAQVVERELRNRGGAVNVLSSVHAGDPIVAPRSSSGMVVLDLDAGTVADANQAFLSMAGFSADALAAGRVGWCSLGLPPANEPAGQALIRSLRTRGMLPLYECKWMRADGLQVDVLIGLTMLDEQRAIGYVIDVSDRRRAEEALRRTEEQLKRAKKLEVMSQLAGGLAHDFNNLLAAIMVQADVLLNDPATTTQVGEGLQKILYATDQAAGLTHRLLSLGRAAPASPQLVRLDELLGRIAGLLEPLMGPRIEVRITRNPDSGHIFVEPAQIEHLVMNLALNARDAMPKGGRLTIETADVAVEHSLPCIPADLTPGAYVALVVTDTGCGMDAVTVERIFDPYFTTKDQQGGSGLGLLMVLRTLRESGGHVLVDSRPGHGTSFKIFFPGAPPAPMVDSAIPSQARSCETTIPRPSGRRARSSPALERPAPSE